MCTLSDLWHQESLDSQTPRATFKSVSSLHNLYVNRTLQAQVFGSRPKSAAQFLPEVTQRPQSTPDFKVDYEVEDLTNGSVFIDSSSFNGIKQREQGILTHEMIVESEEKLHTKKVSESD